MKKILLVAMMVVSAVSFGRDYEFNERRDIVEINQSQIERLSRLTEVEWDSEKAAAKANYERYASFHHELDTMDRGHEDK